MTDYVPLEQYNELKKQFLIAVKCLNEYADEKNWLNIYDESSLDFFPLYSHRKWKKEYGYKPARRALKKIGEIR